MQLAITEVYDEQGNVSPLLANNISGYKKTITVTSGLTLLIQEISCQTEMSFTESTHAGLYISLLTNRKIHCSHSFDSLQVTQFTTQVSGSFTVQAGETKSLLQLQIDPALLAQALNENTESLVEYLTKLIGKLTLKNKQNLVMPLTETTNRLVVPLLNASPEKRLSLLGHIYAFAFLVLEQVQMLAHMLSCTDCQSKLFHVQNLLEADFELTKELADFAYQTGLSAEALELGFYHLVGQTISQYRDQVRLKRAAILRTDGYTKLDIIKRTGFSEAQLETLFIKHFGVPITQYGQIH